MKRTVLAMIFALAACGGSEGDSTGNIHGTTTPLDGTWALTVPTLCPSGTMTLGDGLLNEAGRVASATGTWTCGANSGTVEGGMNLVDDHANLAFRTGTTTLWFAEADVVGGSMTGTAASTTAPGSVAFAAARD
jgi:hypothetical protein